MNKRGQSSTVGTTIAIVLGIALVVFLIWGFSTNWAIFSSTGGAYSGQNNLDAIVNACKTQCQNGFSAQYCLQKKQVIQNGESESLRCFQVPGVTCSNKVVTDYCASDEVQTQLIDDGIEGGFKILGTPGNSGTGEQFA
jgi:hypothetical protein